MTPKLNLTTFSIMLKCRELKNVENLKLASFSRSLKVKWCIRLNHLMSVDVL